jgi:hypothetical protein
MGPRCIRHGFFRLKRYAIDDKLAHARKNSLAVANEMFIPHQRSDVSEGSLKAFEIARHRDG